MTYNLDRVIEATYDLQLTHAQRRIIRALNNVKEGYNLIELGHTIGGAHVNNPAACRVFMSKLRAKLKGSGYTITSGSVGGRGNFGKYKLALETEQG